MTVPRLILVMMTMISRDGAEDDGDDADDGHGVGSGGRSACPR
jgi:hypothetical protein